MTVAHPVPSRVQGVPSSALREICLLKELKHKNIVRYVDQQGPPCLGGQSEEVGASEMGWAHRLGTCLAKPFLLPRLHDVLHSDKKLTLVFEFCDQVKQRLGEWLVTLGGSRGPDRS